MAWMARESSIAAIKSPTGETALISPIDPEFWVHEGNIEIERYFAEHDQYLRESTSKTLLYHYTTLDALHGIVSDRAIWASDVQHLNDRAELSYALENMRALLQKDWGPNSNLQPLDAIFRPGPEHNCEFRCVLFSMLESAQSSSAYGKRVGVSVAFDREHLTRAVQIQSGEVVDCKYLMSADFTDLRSDLEFIRGELKKPNILNRDGALINMALQEELTQKAVKIATSIKHPSFVEERETRLVFSKKKVSDGVQFQVNSTNLTPFLGIDIDGRRLGMSNRRRYANHLGMLEITVWPNSVDDQILDAIDMLLVDVGHVLINRSSSPYRT